MDELIINDYYVHARDLNGQFVRIEVGDWVAPMVMLNPEAVTELRDWLTAWLDARP